MAGRVRNKEVKPPNLAWMLFEGKAQGAPPPLIAINGIAAGISAPKGLDLVWVGAEEGGDEGR